MPFPFVLRSTYDQLKRDRDASAVSARELYLANLKLTEAEHYASEAAVRQNERIEDYKRSCETRDAIMAGMRHEIDAAETRLGGVKAANDLLRAYLANRDEIIADRVQRSAAFRVEMERRAEESRVALDEANEIIARQRDELEQCKRAITELTAKPAKPKRSRVDEACRAQARRPDGGIDPALLRVFRARATELRRKDKNEQEICEAIENGWQVTTGAPSADEIVSRFTDEG